MFILKIHTVKSNLQVEFYIEFVFFFALGYQNNCIICFAHFGSNITIKLVLNL